MGRPVPIKRLTPAEVREFLRGGRKLRGTHDMTGRICHWAYCRHCGLVALKNDATRRALRAPCVQIVD